VYDIIDALDAWKQAQEPVVLARTIALHGFGARTAGETAAITSSGARAGSLLAGAADESLLPEAEVLLRTGGMVSRSTQVRIAEDDAVAAGFACGGAADIMLQHANLLPATALDAFRAGRPLAVASVLGTASVVTVDADGAVSGELSPAELQQAAVEEARQLLKGGVAGSRLVAHGEAQVFVEAFVPVTRLLVVGPGMLADALAAQAHLLGWEPEVLGDDQAACERIIATMRGSDVLVLLTHNFDIDAPILGAAIHQGLGYVGALGSRANQSGRRKRLAEFGLSEEELARYHGPVGLDIGAVNPAETALAICAEAIATLHRREGKPLTGSTASLNG
jgi:xanthine dehydrogenase accessory factor